MKKILSLCFGLILVLTQKNYAQNVMDALNLSANEVSGTARSMGFGNALGSIGGDFGSLSVNPAGLGVYRSSEIAITPTLTVGGTSSQYLGSNSSESNTVMNLNHFGIVFTNAAKGKRYERRNWKSVSFAFGMNRTGDFNTNYSYAAKNTTSSASQAMESDANLNPGNDSIPGTLGFLGYQSYLINENNGKFRTIVPFQGGIDQAKTEQIRGGVNEYLLSFGGNYKEKLLLGLTLGIPSINYHMVSTYTETPSAGNTGYSGGFNSFTYGNAVDITGTGVNLKIGAIYKFSDNIRVGFALHTPTYYTISETSNPSVLSNVNGNSYYISSNDYPIGSQFNYNFTTPWKGVLSGSYIIKSLGFVTADVEFVDYSSMRYSYPAGIDDVSGQTFLQEQSDINQAISNTYKAVTNFRLGGEFRATNNFMVRAGFGYYGNPYQGNMQSLQRIDLSAGIGFHLRHFFTDLGFVHSMYKGTDQPYTVDYSGVVSGSAVTIQPATITYQLNTCAWTIGYKF